MDDKPSSKSAADKKAARSNAIEEQIREQQKRRDERAFLEELAKRITIAREGKHHSDRQEYVQAITCYRRFLAITARAMNVTWEEMEPRLIPQDTRSSECLLISSILFDMMKLLDKMERDSAKEERKACHRLFVRFTLGQNFQNHAAENLRKFLVYRKTIRNKGEFWATYNAIRSRKFCVVATWAFAGEDHPTVEKLRAFRDESLAGGRLGQPFIDLYYAHGESLLAGMRRVPGLRGFVRTVLSSLVRGLPAGLRK